MPKKILKLDQFHGGLNSNSDPRDIADNELSAAQDIMVDELGKIRLMGEYEAHDAGVNSTVLKTGYGLFQFSHDRIGGGIANLEHLNDGGTPTDTNWDTAGGGTFDGNLTHTHTTNPTTSIFTQVAANRVIKGANAHSYKFTYTIAHTSGTEDDITFLRILGGPDHFASGNTNLTQTVGTHETTFTSKSEAADNPFTISITTDDTAVITIDDMSLKAIGAFPETGDDYLLMGDTLTAEIDIYSKDADQWTTGILDLGGDATVKSVFYTVDGAFRVSDGNFDNSNTNQWYGYIHRVDTRHPKALTEINLGSEMITQDTTDHYNRSFTTGGDWIALNVTPNIDDVVANLAQITTTTAILDEGMQLPVANMTTLVAGKRYRIQATLDETTGTPFGPKIYFGIGGGYELVKGVGGGSLQDGTIDTTAQAYSADVLAINATGNLQIYNDGSEETSAIFTVDDVSVKEVGGSVGTISLWKADDQYPAVPNTDSTTLVEKNSRRTTKSLPSSSQFIVDDDVSDDNALTLRIDDGQGSTEIFAIDNTNYNVDVAAKNYTLNIGSNSHATTGYASPWMSTQTTVHHMALFREERVDTQYEGVNANNVAILPGFVKDNIAGEDNVLELPRNLYWDGSSTALDSGGGPSGSLGTNTNVAGIRNQYTLVAIAKNISDTTLPVPQQEIPWNPGDGDVHGAPNMKFDIFITSGHPVLDATSGGLAIKVQRVANSHQGLYFGIGNTGLDSYLTTNLTSLTSADGWNITPDEWSTISIPLADFESLGSEIYASSVGVNQVANAFTTHNTWSGVILKFSHPVATCTWGGSTQRPDAHIYVKDFRVDTDASVTADKSLRFFYSWKYDGVFESPLSQLGETDWNYDSTNLENRSFSMHVRSSSLDLNERITGASVYFKQVGSDDADGSVYKLAELDFQKGYKLVTEDFTEFTNGDWDVSQNVLSTRDISFPSTLPALFTYEMESGHDPEETDFSVKYNTAVVANRTTYIGNVEYDSQVFGDRILKSVVNQFDNFPKTNTIEASIADGDQIVKLEEYADRLLQFKKNKMQLINISQEIEFLEDTFMYKGVSDPCAVCKTDFGIAWVNLSGVYLYDGQKVNNLLEKKGRQIIKESDWADFLNGPSTAAGTSTNESITSGLSATQIGSGGGEIIYYNATYQEIDSADGVSKPSFRVNSSGINVVHTKLDDGTGVFSGDLEGAIDYSSGTLMLSLDVGSEGQTFDMTYDYGLQAGGTLNPLIGYIPKKRQLIIIDDNSASGTGRIFLYDMVTQSWIRGENTTYPSAPLTNFVIDWNADLVLAHTTGTVVKWNDAAAIPNYVDLQTKDLDFGFPGIRKKIYKVYVTFKGDARNAKIHYGVDGLAPTLTFNNITSASDGSSTGSGSDDKCIAYNTGTTDWLKAELKPSASINNVSSFRLKIFSDTLGGSLAADFEINDISIVYRLKNIK